MKLEPMVFDADVQASLIRAQRKLFRVFRDDPHFTGAAIGMRHRAGDYVDEPVVIAMVRKKLAEGQIPLHRMVPATIEVDGRRWGVDVVEVRPLRHPGLPAVANASYRPGPDAGAAKPNAVNDPIRKKFTDPVQGAGISNATGSLSGTLGCFVRDLDNNDGRICFLSSNSVLARVDQPAFGEAIYQPARQDGGGSNDAIGTVRRFSELGTTATVDAAIGVLNSGVTADLGVADGLMAPISATHPAIGMITASDTDPLQRHVNSFISRMDHIVDALHVELSVADDEHSCIAAPQLFSHIEKVGHASGYTSSMVTALAAIVKIDYGFKYVTLTDQIWSQAFCLPGDSGALVLAGGNGRTFVQEPEPPTSNCELLATVGHYYDLPLADDNDLTSQARDQFLAQSPLGNLLIGAIYLNQQTVIDRLGGKEAEGVAIGYAKEYYDKYRTLVATVLANPDSGATMTQENIDDLEFMFAGMTGGAGIQPVLDQDEAQVAYTLLTGVVANTVGMNYQQIIDYMNDPGVFQTVYDQLATLPSVNIVGPVVAG
ncbi:hypothetical protein [Actinocatenispora sera]|uniref:Uncharacterized protein n=1 Tax=Actinocatenispora sera TaxID=390989 RepID=A0A810L1I3_9ACTN|nr:hypothetical protein [Actinocatenispora sera]BCJ29294.1 hypothetical protein Asera_34020 [Actinocatenispora sera]